MLNDRWRVFVSAWQKFAQRQREAVRRRDAGRVRARSLVAMPDERPPEVLGALPRTRPHRRSNKRPTRTQRVDEAGGTPDAPPTRKRGDSPPPPEPSRSRLPSGTEIVGTVVQAAAELAEIGISMTARALRRTVSRLPRP